MTLPSRIAHHASRSTPPRPRESGMAVIVVMALVALVLIYLAGNTRTLYSLGRELKLIDRLQTRRLQAATQPTNSIPATNISLALPTSSQTP